MSLRAVSPGALKEQGWPFGHPETPHFCWPTDPLQIGSVQLNTSGRVLSVANKLYLETHRGRGMEQTSPDIPPGTVKKHDPG